MTFLLFESERNISHFKILIIVSQLLAASAWLADGEARGRSCFYLQIYVNLTL